jgi:hypothetical protein
MNAIISRQTRHGAPKAAVDAQHKSEMYCAVLAFKQLADQ